MYNYYIYLIVIFILDINIFSRFLIINITCLRIIYFILYTRSMTLSK